MSSIDRLTEIIETSGADYGMRVAKGLNIDADTFLNIGYNANITTSEEDIWSGSAAYVFPAAAAQWRIAGGNAAELGTVIKGNAEGANQTIKCDATGNSTTLVDADVDFSASTAVAVGDIVLLDPKGTNPEYGYVTDITNSATGTLVIGNGFSRGGSCNTARAYTIVDKSSGTGTGGQVVEIEYLDASFNEKRILVCLNGATAVDFKGPTGAALTDTYRVNEMSLVAVGSGGVAVAAIALQLQASPNTVYCNISAGYTHSRDGFYTVPKDKMLYIRRINFAATTNNDTKVQAARVMLRATMEKYNHFRTPGIWHVYAEALISNASQLLQLELPLSFSEGVDIKCSAIGLTGFTGPVATILRGWTETA